MYKKPLVLFTITLIWLSFVFSAMAQSSEILLLKRALQQPHTDSTQAKLYIDLGKAYTLFRADSATYFLAKGISLAKKIADKHLLADAYYNLGITNEPNGNYAQALTNFRQAEQISRYYSLDSSRTNIQVRIVRALRGLGNYQNALKLALTLKYFYEKYPQQQNKLTGVLLTELAVIYDRLGRTDSTLTYLLEAKKFAQKRRNKPEMASSLGNLSHFYTTTKDFARAEYYQKQAIHLHQQAGFLHGISTEFLQLAQIKSAQQDYTNAISNYKKALAIMQRVGSQEYIGECLIGLAKCHLALRNYSKASVYAAQAEAIYQSNKSLYFLQQTLEIQAGILEKSGHYKQALRVTRKAQFLRNSLIGLEKIKAISEIQASYNLKQKQNQITALRKDISYEKQAKQTIQLKLSLAQNQRFFLLIISILMVLLAGFIYTHFRRQRKLHKVLTQQTNRITLQAQQLAELNSTKDKLFSLISHDLRSPVARLKQGFYQFRATSQLSASSLKPFDQLEEQVDRLLDLLTNLLEWSQAQLKGFRLHTQRIYLTELVEEVHHQLAAHLRQKEITLFHQLSSDIAIIADKAQINSVIRNVVSNAIKFTPDGGYIRLHAIEKDNQVELQIRDTGIGMTPEQLDNLLTVPQARLGTRGEQGMGLGLQLCQLLLANQSGSLYVESSLQQGTTVFIRLPNSNYPGEISQTLSPENRQLLSKEEENEF